MGLASRREAELWITEGRIAVNGKAVTELGTKITPGADRVTVDGKPVAAAAPPRVYWLLHKPDETLTARGDAFQRQTIYDLPKLRKVPFLVAPVGRLDFRTEGLLLMTNDGELANRLTHPKFEIPRTYHLLINGRLTPEEERAIAHGVTLEDGPTGRAELKFAHGQNLGKSRGAWYSITVYEGRNRLVRRLFEHFNHKVVRLIRVAYGGVRLPEELKPGDYVQMKPDQIRTLKRAVGLK